MIKYNNVLSYRNTNNEAEELGQGGLWTLLME